MEKVKLKFRSVAIQVTDTLLSFRFEDENDYQYEI